ncbi:MAG: saccharopine dehydrogenase NADP-binding domain-containing protein [Flavobacteriales bacterium]|nr:saccharopine dehydrogenase NADP-binding domain-containing protein [Flavobacteriales bacterium]MCB9448764.1 saccharopine dehydrogenase NADP-binding domain-containing protein [Flavobacteriales bacterium]
MKNILILGAGKSASTLIRYMAQASGELDAEITVADMSESLAAQKTEGAHRTHATGIDITDAASRSKEIQQADIVISLLPPHLHELAADTCLEMGRNLVTASYTSDAMKAKHKQVAGKDLIFLNEAGLDPGIDHMSAMQVLDRLRDEGANITAFRSYCGGLVDPESVDSPWGYKFTWNPRNVVMAGQGTAKYIENGHYKYIPYNRLFAETTMTEVEGHGFFEGYANRDSLSYREAYGLTHIPTIIRGTLRVPGFCQGWNAFVKLGWTDDSCIIADADKHTYTSLLDAYLPAATENEGIHERAMTFLNPTGDPGLTEKLEWLGLFDHIPLKGKNTSAAGHLQALLEEKWALHKGDIDMIVMQHQFEFEQKGQQVYLASSLVVKGDDNIHTAMSKTVGLPLGICAKLILQGKVKERGVLIPTTEDIYVPVLKELESFGIRFTETEY